VAVCRQVDSETIEVSTLGYPSVQMSKSKMNDAILKLVGALDYCQATLCHTGVPFPSPSLPGIPAASKHPKRKSGEAAWSFSSLRFAHDGMSGRGDGACSLANPT
jgi:hypothetical protein